ncbi:RNA-directed DNA polymerase [Niabella pedocola]|uniref:RNA-directed DNA polymerase n=1 Tax=Niabella pedocola TaxID=1752077 RepID=A0ABS8PL04_9BACT|nr:RNA-directed DNA polymerase [Niabella pedocola]MCD2421785.1 RNA-directed DNA polymerase [Niabella pedocola]
MALVSDNLKKNGVKIMTHVGGVPSVGSGVVYETPNYCDYNYVLTAKHIFQEDSLTPFDLNSLSYVEVFYSDTGKLKRLYYVKKAELKKRLITFDSDFAILIINKKDTVNFHQIFVTDIIDDNDRNFFSWGTFAANENEIHLFKFKRNDNEVKRLKLSAPPSCEALPGISGSGIFIKNKHVLYGIICRYPNDNLENDTIDCTRISFEEINIRLISLKLLPLDTQSSKYKKEIQNVVVDIHQAIINGVCLDLELARKRLQTDIADDWFHDPLKYIDLLDQGYLFKQFAKYFNGKKYVATRAEQFYVPKKKLTLRQALILPFIDRIMYMAVVGVLAEKMEKSMIPTVYSARYNKYSDSQLILNGVEQWKKMKYALLEHANAKDTHGNYMYGAVIEIDLLNFYDNINKNLLIEKIKRVCDTENEKLASVLLSEMLQNFSERPLGLPQNSDASSLLASFYLNQVDIFMQNNTCCYFRFMDDIRIFCKDKYEARRILQDFEAELRRCDLSVNSQKTEIKTIIAKTTDKPGEIHREDFDLVFDLRLNKIARLRNANNYAYLNQAFHESVALLGENIQEDLIDADDAAKRLNYALNTIEFLGQRSIQLNSNNFFENILAATKSLYDKPWLTTQVCKVLNLINRDKITEELLIVLKQIITEENYNTYSFQTYQIWLLLAKLKYKSKELIRYATGQVEKNDETNRPVIAAMIIYLCSVEDDYKRVILRKFGQGFTRRYFQNRIALIALRSFEPELIPSKQISASLKDAPEFTNKFGHRDLVYVYGLDETNDDQEENFEQLYSL